MGCIRNLGATAPRKPQKLPNRTRHRIVQKSPVMIDLGVNLLALAQRMGHSDPAITLRLYGHFFEGAQMQLSEKDRRAQAASMPTEDRLSRYPGVAGPPDVSSCRFSGFPPQQTRRPKGVLLDAESRPRPRSLRPAESSLSRQATTS